MYLAGYGAECLLKAYLIQYMNTPTLASAVDALNEQRRSRGQERIENIARTAAGHKILYLLQLTDLPQYPAYDPRLWGRVALWQSSWRYETDPVLHSAAIEFIDDVQAATDWLLPKIEGG